MKAMTIDDIHYVCLDILKEFHSFCVHNNLKYSLEGGTLLGSIRHKGFIPWDDDVDIMMPRPDYNKFLALYRDSEDYMCFADERKNCFIAFSRLADMKRTRVYSSSYWTEKKTGVWIDIFPVDGVGTDKDVFLSSAGRITTLYKNLRVSRDAMAEFGYFRSFPKIMKWLVKKVKYGKSVYRHLYNYISYCLRCDYETSKYVSILSYAGNSELFFNKEIMNNYIEVPFEDCSFFVIADYELYLKSVFGDYMKLPPEDQRIVHPNNFFWID